MRSKNVSRSINLFKKDGIKAVSVEKFNSHVGEFGIRQDLLGFIDVLALDHKKGVIGIQVCAHGEINKHIEKLYSEEVIYNMIDWLETPGTFLEIHGWRKLKRKLKNGKFGKSYYWKVEIIEYEVDDLLPF